MNKLLIEKDSIIDIKDKEYDIEIINNCHLKLNVLNSSEIKILIKSNVKIEIVLEENINLLINQLGINSSIDYIITLKEKSKINVIDSIISSVDSINNIKIIHKGNNSETKFYTNGINISNNKMYYYLDGIINKDIKGVFLVENSKIINYQNGDSKIIPNLIVDTKEVNANHSAFIGTLNKDDISYLMSRGISKKDANNLLLKSILLSKMSLNTDIFIKEILNILKGEIK